MYKEFFGNLAEVHMGVDCTKSLISYTELPRGYAEIRGEAQERFIIVKVVGLSPISLYSSGLPPKFL